MEMKSKLENYSIVEGIYHSLVCFHPPKLMTKQIKYVRTECKPSAKSVYLQMTDVLQS